MEQNVWEQVFLVQWTEVPGIVKLSMMFLLVIIIGDLIFSVRKLFICFNIRHKANKVLGYLKDIKGNSDNNEKKEDLERELFEYIQNNFDTNSSEEKIELFNELKKKISFWYCKGLLKDDEVIDYLNKLM